MSLQIVNLRLDRNIKNYQTPRRKPGRTVDVCGRKKSFRDGSQESPKQSGVLRDAPVKEATPMHTGGTGATGRTLNRFGIV